MSQYWSNIVHQLKPYVPGEQPLAMKYIKLNTNENPYPPSPMVTEAVHSCATESLKRYPDPESTELRQSLAEYYQLELNQVFIGNGSDEVLAHCFQAFFQQDKPILFPDISYSFYPVYCGLYQIDYLPVALNAQFEINIEDYRQPNGGIIIPNPNAPTGIALSLDSIEQILQDCQSVVIIDEAYVDFGAESAVSLIARHPNLIVVQTFSKSRSLAGIRLGYALGQGALIEGLERVKNSFNSYPIDRLASACGIASIEDEAYFQQCRRDIMKTREGLNGELQGLGFDVLPSSSNFVFARHAEHSAAELYEALKQAGILVRHFKSSRIDNFLRISIGTADECRSLINTLRDLV